MHYFTPKRCETTTKIMYHDRQTAWQAAEQSRIERGVELWVYQCQYCGQWHLTHRDPAQEGFQAPSSLKSADFAISTDCAVSDGSFAQSHTVLNLPCEDFRAARFTESSV